MYLNLCINLAFASSPPGAFPLRQIGGSTPFIDKFVIVLITMAFNLSFKISAPLILLPIFIDILSFYSRNINKTSAIKIKDIFINVQMKKNYLIC